MPGTLTQAEARQHKLAAQRGSLRSLEALFEHLIGGDIVLDNLEVALATFDAIVGGDASLGITGVTPLTTVDGGAIAIAGGDSIAGATGAGGAVTVSGGDAGSTNAAGGAVTLTGGDGAGTGEGGDVILQAGDGGTGLDGQIYIRPGTALPVMTKVLVPVSDSTTATDMTEAILLSGIHAKDPGGDLSYQLPTGTEIKAALGAGLTAGDSFDFTLINIDATAAVVITLVVDTDITIVGDPNVQALADTATLAVSSGTFRIRFVTGTTFVCYRVA